ncbi:MAG: outer membrane lipoprotein-sorting protein [Candidatus Cloacimonetes bacterium]|nr:outer membrane lipoprotein-sorting protein [Candidatus Cloacimonadota bacterium]
MRYFWVAVLFLMSCGLIAETADEILKMVDDNMYNGSQIVEARMVINGRRGSREIGTRSWSVGTEDSFTEYLSPPREAGTKMLKLGDDLWIYDKNSDRIIQISGHLLRQSVNGSDLSYEDFMEESNFRDRYTAEITGEEEYNGRNCQVLLLTAKSSDVTYQQLKLWIDQEYWLPLQEELYGSSGTVLKRVTLSDMRQVKERWYPFHIHYKDVLNTSGNGTDVIIDKIEFDADIPASRMSKAQLRK